MSAMVDAQFLGGDSLHRFHGPGIVVHADEMLRHGVVIGSHRGILHLDFLDEFHHGVDSAGITAENFLEALGGVGLAGGRQEAARQLEKESFLVGLLGQRRFQRGDGFVELSLGGERPGLLQGPGFRPLGQGLEEGDIGQLHRLSFSKRYRSIS